MTPGPVSDTYKGPDGGGLTAGRFFSFSNAGGFEFHDTLDEAKASAEDALDCEREHAGDCGWEEGDTLSICYGTVAGQVVETQRMCWLDHMRQQGTPEEDLPKVPRFDQFVEYALLPATPPALPEERG